MCFSQGGSLAFLGMGLGTGLFLRSRGHPPRRYWLFIYFAMMEAIQFMVSAGCLKAYLYCSAAAPFL